MAACFRVFFVIAVSLIIPHASKSNFVVFVRDIVACRRVCAK